jgi:ABC-type dipeptide/oligopeptide/nickel transport system permease component
MAKFVLRRFRYAIILLAIASLCMFSALRLAPGNPADVTAGIIRSPDLLAQLKDTYGLDRPLPTQYWLFMRGILTGNPGSSLVTGSKISDIITSSGANTLRLSSAGLLLTYLTAIPLGALAAWRRNSRFDQSVRALTVLGVGVPSFFLAVLLIQVFAVELRWFPVAGPGGLDHLVLPALVLAAESVAINVRLMRSSMLDELGKEYVTVLRAKGLSSRSIVGVHVLRNALVPVIALAGATIPLIIGYTLIVEVIFRYEGLGYQLVQSITNRDYPLAQTLAFMFTALVILSNFLADVAHQWLDPKVRQ